MKKFQSGTSHALGPSLPLSQTVTPSRTPSPSSVRTLWTTPKRSRGDCWMSWKDWSLIVEDWDSTYVQSFACIHRLLSKKIYLTPPEGWRINGFKAIDYNALALKQHLLDEVNQCFAKRLTGIFDGCLLPPDLARQSTRLHRVQSKASITRGQRYNCRAIAFNHRKIKLLNC